MIARLRRPRDVSSEPLSRGFYRFSVSPTPLLLSLSLSFPLRLTSVSTRPCLKPDIELGEGIVRGEGFEFFDDDRSQSYLGTRKIDLGLIEPGGCELKRKLLYTWKDYPEDNCER